MDLQRNREIEKECCKDMANFQFQPYTDGTAELKCKICGHVIKSFDKPEEKQNV